jgi:hypothetical protein
VTNPLLSEFRKKIGFDVSVSDSSSLSQNSKRIWYVNKAELFHNFGVHGQLSRTKQGPPSHKVKK